MNPHHDDDPLHTALREVGPGLPEPAPSGQTRERIAALAGALAPRPRSAARRALTTGALAAASLALLALAGSLWTQNQRLRAQLDRALALRSGEVVPAHREVPPLVAVRFYHPQCEVARAVEPRFEAMERAHPSEQVLFVSLDISENAEAQSAKLAGALDCGFVFSCDGTPVSSGMVVLADTRTRRVIKAAHGTMELPELEQVLDRALLACEAPGRGG